VADYYTFRKFTVEAHGHQVDDIELGDLVLGLQ
jgi:hypothetical protein